MEKLTFNKLAVLILAVIFLSGCNQLQNMVDNADQIQYDVEPSPLEMHAEKVDFNLNGRFPAEYFDKKVVVTGTPTLKYDGKSKELKPITVQGEDVEGNNKVISWDNGGSFTYSESFDFEEGMEVAELVLKLSASRGDETKDLGEVRKLADGTIITPRLVKKGMMVDNGGYESGESAPSYALAKETLPETTTDTYKSDIHYMLQSSNVRYSEMNEEDVQGMLDEIKAAVENELKFDGVKISSYASPDGDLEKINRPLSEKRGETAKSFVEREMSKMDMEAEEAFDVESTPEDWEGFKELVQRSNMEDKDLILRVLSMYNDVERREEEIKKLAEAYETLKDGVLPELRRSKIFANFITERRTNEELLTLVDEDPTQLNAVEFLNAAMLPENLDEQVRIYDEMIKQFPNDWRPYNNKGVVLAYQNKMDEANEAFDHANGLQENEVTQNNLGAVAFVNKNYEDAAAYFDNAAQSGSMEAAYNRGVIHIMNAEYDEAVDQFGTSKSFNAGLAQLLSGDNEKAMQTLNQANSDHAWMDYLKAVVAARQNEVDKVVEHLGNAVKKDSAIKDYAKTDMEFGRFFEVDAFKNVVN